MERLSFNALPYLIEMCLCMDISDICEKIWKPMLLCACKSSTLTLVMLHSCIITLVCVCLILMADNLKYFHRKAMSRAPLPPSAHAILVAIKRII